MGATQDPKYCIGCLPTSQSWFQRNREARAGVGRKKINKMIYRPKHLLTLVVLVWLSLVREWSLPSWAAHPESMRVSEVLSGPVPNPQRWWHEPCTPLASVSSFHTSPGAGRHGKQFLAAASGTTLVLYYRSYCHRDVLIFIWLRQREPLPFLQERPQ